VPDFTDFPRRFASYVLLKPLARGGMGELYLALSGARGMEKLCVIKRVLPDVALIAPENVQRFRDEATVVVRLSHGNLVPVFDAGRADDQIFLAMDFVDGKDLLATWNRCAERAVPFPLEIAAYIVKELARGLAYAHAFDGLNLVHRDVSPANVLLSYTGEVRLTDFGLALSTLKQQQTAPGIIFGKLSYIAPEQARSGTLDGRTDIYAAGILLWEMLTGQQLFPSKAGDQRRDSTALALDQVRDPRVPSPSKVTSRVPPELDRIAMRALAPDPAQRYQTGEELRADLAAYLGRTAPKTDSDQLATFMRDLFGGDIGAERQEREGLVRRASHWLTGPIITGRPGSGASANASAPAPASADAHSVPRAARESDGDSKDPRIGTTIGERYFLRRLCGEGAMGRVYEGQHVDIGRRVAVKILQSIYRHTPDVVERFRREARAASKIGHANIIDVTDSGTTADGAFYFVMEYLDGINLEELINREGVLPATRAILIGAQICRALQAAHAVDIIHRDLKPANVMLVNRKEEEDFVKVLDFGISKSLVLDGPPNAGSSPGKRRGLTNPDVAVGTPAYMSPEQAGGLPADARTDVYAVGGLLYEMLTGCPPCEGDNILTILNKKAMEDPKPARELRSDIPVDLEAVIMRALSRFADDRQPSMTALKDDLLRCLGALQGAPDPAGARPLRRAPSGPTLRVRTSLAPRAWVVGATGAALLGGVGIWGLTRPVERPSPMPALVQTQPQPQQQVIDRPLGGGQGSTASASIMASRAAAPARTPLAGSTETGRPEVTPIAGTATAPSPSPSPATVSDSHAAPRRRVRATAVSEAGAPPIAAAAPTPAPAPSSAAALLRAQAAFNKGNYPEAIRRGREAVAGGASPGAHLLLGDVYYHMERYAEAQREYQAALKLEPASAPAMRGLELASKRVEPGAAGF
jgi:serine/threonine protein kinase